jgi:transcriptional regulator with XRE-family HTH domain
MRTGHVLRGYRVQAGLSPEEFAKKLGVAVPTLRSLENGTRPITPERAKEIEERLDGALTRAQLRPDMFEAAA